MTGRVVCLLSIAAALAAQQPPSGHPGTIEGTMVDSVTGAPVKKVVASIQASRDLTYGAATDSGGRFQFVNVEPGRYVFSQLAAQGYREIPTDKTFSKPITLAEDQHITGLRLKMISLGVITGKVSDTRANLLPASS